MPSPLSKRPSRGSSAVVVVSALAIIAAGAYVVVPPWLHPHDPWRWPSTIPAERAALVREGERLFNETALHLGPTTAKAISGNGMACRNCHLSGGTVRNAMGLVGITRRFPQFNARAGKKILLEDRINGCFERSLNGRSLPNDSPEMKAMVAYMAWLSEEVPAEMKKMPGQGVMKLTDPPRAANPDLGADVFQRKCVSCHGAQGQGSRNADGTYLYPPLWGPDSFNNGAGMHRVRTAAGFIYRNMPLGDPLLNVNDAYDVAAFINSQPRPQRAGVERDYPDRRLKPFDSPYAPWADSEDPLRHKYGPFPRPVGSQ